MEGGEIKSPNLEMDFSEVEQLRQEIEVLRAQNKELKKALLSSLDARIYSLLGLCGFPKKEDLEESSED